MEDCPRDSKSDAAMRYRGKIGVARTRFIIPPIFEGIRACRRKWKSTRDVLFDEKGCGLLREEHVTPDRPKASGGRNRSIFHGIK